MQQTAKKHVGHAISGFELSKKVLNNLYNYDLKPITKLVLLYLCDCYNPKHGEMFPKQSTIAQKLGVSEVSVIRAIQELHKEGLLVSERKYINRYRFTSKIVEEQSENEYKEMRVKTYQNENPSIKMIAHKHEQKREQNNLTKVEDFKILKEYAESKGAKNVKAYIEALKRNGSAQAIIADYKVVQSSKKWHEKQSNETMHNIEEVRNLETASYEDCQKLKDVLFKNWGVKKA